MAHHKPFSKACWSSLQKRELDACCHIQEQKGALASHAEQVCARYQTLMLRYAGALDADSRILELGCGVSCVAQGFPAGQVTYVDSLLDDYRRVCPGALPKGQLIASMAEEFDGEAQAYDVILATRLLSYVENPELVLHEVERMLKPDGVFLLSVELWPKPLAWLHYRLSRMGMQRMLKHHLYCYTRQGLEHSLKRHFTIESRQSLPISSLLGFIKKEYFYVCRLPNS